MATLSGNKIKDTYQSLIKLTDNGNLTTGAKQLTDGFGNNSPLYISTTQIGIGVTPEATYDLHVYSNAKVGGNLTVTGDLTVEGTTTTIDTQTLTVEDPLIEVASNNTSTDAVDIGWYGKYAPSGTTLYAGLFRDTGDSKFKLFRNLEEQPTTTVNTSGTGYTVATLVADLEGTLTGVIASTTTATTQSLADNSTKVATTAYVDSSIGNSTLAEVLANGDTTGGGNIVFGDSDVFLSDDTLMFGASNDLVIYHDGSNSFIREKGTGNLYIDGETSISLRKYTGAEKMLVANTDGSVELYYDDSKKLETTSTGVTVTGDLTVDTDTLFVDSTNNRVGILTTNPSDALNVDDDVSGSVRITIDNANAAGFSTLRFEENDTERAALYYSNAADTFNLQNNTNSGNLRLQTTNSIGTTTSGIIINGSSEAVELYYAGTKKFETTSTGVTITGTSIHTGIEIEDTSPQILFDETDVTANWRNRVSGGSWRVQYAPDGSSFSDQFVVGGSNATFETDATFAGDVTVNGGDIILGGTGRIQGIDTVSASTDAASKGYVDSIVTAQDLDFAGDSGTGAVDLDSQTFTIAGTTNEIETSASSQTLTIGLPNDVIITGDLTAGYLGDPYLLYADATNARVDIYGNTRMIGGGTRSIQFINDTTNTIAGEIEFDHATENLSFFTNFDTTNPKMVIDSSGNVGINESDPDTILHISDGNTGDPSTNAPVIRLQNTSENCSNLFTDGDVVGGLEFYNDSIICTDIAYAAGVNAYVRAVHDGSDSPTPTSSLEFGTGSAVYASTRMTIDSSGNVGIGTDSPDVKLHVDGGDLRVRDTGNVAFQIISSSSGNSAIQFGDDGDLNDGRIVYENTGDNMLFYTNDAEKMRIDSDGNVGIGTDSPTHLLNLEETDTNSVQLVIDNNNTSDAGTETSTIRFRHYRSYIAGLNDAGEITLGKEEAWDASGDRNSYMSFGTRTGASGVTEKMRIDSGGDVYIKGQANPTLYFQTNSTTTTNMFLIEAASYVGTAPYNSNRLIANNSSNIAFETGGSERMRIDSSGTTTMIKTSSGSSTTPLVVRNSGSTNVGTESKIFLSTVANDDRGAYISSIITDSSNGNALILATNSAGSTPTERMRIHSDGIIDLGDCAQVVPSSVTSFIRFVPAADTTVDLGAGSKRWEEVFSVQSSINTSDENEKQQIENLDEVELRVAQRIKGLIRKFKWNSAVENKGDNARIHFGVIAQDLQRAFEAEGLDAEKYGLFCSDTWWEEEVTETDEEGNEKTTIKTYEEYKEGTIEKTRLGVRYTELLAFVIAAL